MRNNKGKGMAKSALAAALSLSMSLSGLALPATAVTVAANDTVSPLKTLDFNDGLAEFRYDKEAGTGDVNYSIVKPDSFYYAKSTEKGEVESGEHVDANGLVYTGSGSDAKYAKTIFSNQPATSTDDVKGTALTLDKTIHTEAIVKEKASGVAGTNLDEEIPVGSVAREAMTWKSQMYLSNPFYNQTSEKYTLTYWEYVAEGTTTDTGLIAFENGDAVVSLYYDADNAATPAGTWAQVAVVFTADGAECYVNGAATESCMVAEGGDYALSTITGAEKILFGASSKSELEAQSIAKLDDVTFYASALSDVQIASVYNRAAEKLSPSVDVSSPTAVYSLSDEAQFNGFTDASGDSTVSIEETTLNGKTIQAAHIRATTRKESNSGIKAGLQIKENPFANDDSVEGITIGYWVKRELGSKDKTTPNYYNLMLADDEKYIYNPKEQSQGGTGRTYLYVNDALDAVYQEGSTYQVGSYLKNTYTFGLSDEEATTVQAAASEWHYVTMVATNAGIQMYVDGVAYTNATKDIYGARFSDGYYTQENDRKLATTLYGEVGGTNNQLATQLMTFVRRSDTKIYFGWQPSSFENTTTGNAQTSGLWVYNVSCYSGAMDATEVAALYKQEVGGDTPATSEEPNTTQAPEQKVTYGDVDENGKVDASDALATLKSVVGLTTLSDSRTKAADVDGDGKVTTTDALNILKKVVNLISAFPVEK